MKKSPSSFFESPHTVLGWLSVGLTVLFTALFVSVTNDFLKFSGLLTITFGVIAGVLSLITLIWKHERSWLVWLMLLPGMFAILFALGEILVPH